MQIDTTRFGRIEVPEEAVIHFPRGLYGLDGTRHYCLLQHDPAGTFHWLQAVDAPAIAMVVTVPFYFIPDYEVEIPDAAAEILQASAASELHVYTSITVAEDGCSIYTNLLGPLLINRERRLGMQLIQDETRYTTKHLIGRRLPAEEAA